MLKLPRYNLISVLIGGALGVCCAEMLIPVAKVVSAVLVRFMQTLAVPLIFFSLLNTVLDVKETARLRKIFSRTALYTIGTTVTAALLGLLLYKIIDPAAGVVSPGAESFVLKGSYSGTLMNLVPTNIFDIFISGNVIGAVAFALILGFVGRGLPTKLNGYMHKGATLLSEVFLSLARRVVGVLPLFLWAFVLLFVQDLKENFVFGTIAQYAGVVLATNTIHAFVLLPILLKIKGFPFLQTYKGALPALSVASLSKSSAVAIPTSLHVSTENLNVRPEIARFTIPVCATINMNGCAAFIFVTSVFMIEVFQGPMDLWMMLVGVVVATCVAVGNAGVPMGCFFLTLSLLSALGVPTHMMGLLLPFFTVLDMYETGINVWSDIIITRCIDKDLQK